MANSTGFGSASRLLPESLCWLRTVYRSSMSGSNKCPAAEVRALSAVGLWQPELRGLTVKNTQSSRSQRPLRLARGSDDCHGNIRHLNRDFLQCRSAIRHCADILDSERRWSPQHGGDARQCAQLEGIAACGLASSRRREPIHRQPCQRLNVLALTHLACNRQCNMTPIPRHFIEAGFPCVFGKRASAVSPKWISASISVSKRSNPLAAALGTTRTWGSSADRGYPSRDTLKGCRQAISASIDKRKAIHRRAIARQPKGMRSRADGC